jgi:hypothetical protein
MGQTFSTRNQPCCPAPQITVAFPAVVGGGGPKVVLANGAIIDLHVLAQIITENCPAVAGIVSPATAARVCPTSAPELAHITPIGPFN